MGPEAKAAFITAMAACCNARLIAMQEQNMSDRLVGRPPTYQPFDFESEPFNHGLGHNQVVEYLRS